MPRTGSSYVRRVLRLYSNFPSVECNINEPFSNINFESLLDKQEYFSNLHNTLTTQDKLVVKNHYYQLVNLKKTHPKMYEMYIDTAFTSFLLLRKNFFETSLSNAIAKKTAVWGDDGPQATFADITCEDLISSMNWYKTLWKMVADNPLGMHYTNVLYYEDLTFLPDADYKYITTTDVEYLVDSVTTPSNDKKNVVKNYFELQRLSLDFIKDFEHDRIINKNGELTLK